MKGHNGSGTVELTEDQRHALRLVQALEAMAELQATTQRRVDQLIEAMGPPEVLFSGTTILDANGHATAKFPRRCRSVSLVAGSAAVTIAGGGAQSSTPVRGPGVHVIPAGASRVVVLDDVALTLYGLAGDSVSLVVYSDVQPPAAAPGGVAAAAKGAKSAPVDVAVAGVATQILAANPERISATIANNGAGTLYVGRDNTVTVANGIPVGTGQSLDDEVSGDAWWGISSANSDVRVLEVS